MNTRMPYHKKKHMFGMYPLDANGIPLVVDGARVQELEDWPSFWHFCVTQWGGFMRHVSLTSLSHSKTAYWTMVVDI